VVVDLKATTKVNPRMKDLRKMLTEWQVAELKVVRDQMDYRFTRNEKRLFATEGATGGRKWPPLDPEYAKQKRRTHSNRKIMQRSGKTRQQFVNKSNPAHVAIYSTKPRPSVTLGADSEVAAYHIKPKPRLPNPAYNPRMPDRDVMQMTRKQERGLVQIAQDYIAEVKLPRVQRVLAAWQRTGGGA
jgi:hypothetical protein